jgi:hypothetical protein
LRSTRLGSESVFRVLDESDGLITAAVVRAPQLEPGMLLRLVPSAAQAMDRVESTAEPARFVGRLIPDMAA